jgi:hypothetical protein
MRMESTRNPFWTQIIIATMTKSLKQKTYRENNRSQRDTGETRNRMEPSYFTKLRPLQWITYTSVFIPPNA